MNSQLKYDIRCEWGIHGVKSLASDSDVIIVVDVLSFSTSVDIACSRGASVIPYNWNDERAVDFALENNAVLAKSRNKSDLSLSPNSLLKISSGTKIVLPSPNGSTISLATGDVPTICGCLRNFRSVADYAMSIGKRISVIPAGEKWEDGSIRFAIEDLLGAGAILSSLGGDHSPESEVAVNVYHSLKNKLSEVTLKCSSGIELFEKGFEEDIRLATERCNSTCVPVLKEGCYSAI